ncbi:MAG TPA: hypothetical protein VG099_24555, partial [Gemmataceae bacterium]|nr:hypothetical protein [Gemmataceae bacterium]
GQDERLHSIACSPDGRLLATVSLSGAFVVWDAGSHKMLHWFPGEPGQCNIAFSPDSQWLTSGSYDGGVALWEARSGQQVLKPAGHAARVFAVAFGPDGRTLLTGSDDSTVLMWDLRPGTELKHAGDMARLWADLAESDAAAAYKAIWQLADRPELTVPFLKARLTPAKPMDRERLRKSLDHLDSNKFEEREAASKALTTLGDAIEPELRHELSQAPSAEKRSRLQTLLKAATGQGSAEDARQARAVVALTWAKTPEALQLLRDLAGGAPHARLTQEARTALKHLDSDQK